MVNKAKKIANMSEEERKAELEKLKQDYLALVSDIKKQVREKEQKATAANRKKINHAKYLVAGEFLKTDKHHAIEIINRMIEDANTTDRNREDLKLLLATLR